jgi:hypothetical protein
MRVFQEGNETAQIDLTDSLTSGINRARQTLGTLIVCIIQVGMSGWGRFSDVWIRAARGV